MNLKLVDPPAGCRLVNDKMVIPAGATEALVRVKCDADHPMPLGAELRFRARGKMDDGIEIITEARVEVASPVASK